MNLFTEVFPSIQAPTVGWSLKHQLRTLNWFCNQWTKVKTLPTWWQPPALVLIPLCLSLIILLVTIHTSIFGVWPRALSVIHGILPLCLQKQWLSICPEPLIQLDTTLWDGMLSQLQSLHQAQIQTQELQNSLFLSVSLLLLHVLQFCWVSFSPFILALVDTATTAWINK